MVDKGLKAYREAGIDAHGYVCDVTNEAAVQALVGRIEAEVGVVDILVNNAGIIRLADRKGISMAHLICLTGMRLSTKKFITMGGIVLRLTPPNYSKIRTATCFEANIALALASLRVDSAFFRRSRQFAREKRDSRAEVLRCALRACDPVLPGANALPSPGNLLCVDGSLEVDGSDMRIAPKGLECLQENTIMQRMYKAARGTRDVIPVL